MTLLQYLHKLSRHVQVRIVVVISIIVLTWAGSVRAAPNVAVSIAPLHSLVSGVMAGVGRPELLVAAGQSPHTQSLSPSMVKAVHNADLVIWIGPDYEIPLNNTMDQVDAPERVKSLANSGQLLTYPVRESGLWAPHEAHAGHSRQSERRENIDPHLWLSADNAKAMVMQFRAWLTAVDPENADTYQHNANRMIVRIENLEAVLAENLGAVKTMPYVVFHDAYQYFEKEFGLNPAGSITLSPERPVGAKRVRQIRKAIISNQVKCIFSEPQFPPGLIPTIMENTDAHYGQLDPLGAGLQPGADLWFDLMTRLGQSLNECLSRNQLKPDQGL